MSFKPLPASSVIPGHIRADGRFVCDVPLANGELCGTDLKNDGDSIRSHKHKCKKHPDYKPETRKMPFAESQHGKKTPARTTSCVHCDNAVECKTPLFSGHSLPRQPGDSQQPADRGGDLRLLSSAPT
ncbi:hypothetical protein PG988_015956 [Apiospora saccharicola]